MNEILKEHMHIELPSTLTAREMLHLNGEATGYDLNYAGNTYLMALHELKQQAATIVELRAFIEDYAEQLEFGGNPKTAIGHTARAFTIEAKALLGKSKE